MSDDFRLTPQAKPTKSLNYQERVKAGLQRGGLRKVSKDKQRWVKLYHNSIEEDGEIQSCFSHNIVNSELNIGNEVCSGSKEFMSRHHPKGRHEKNILYYKYCCLRCHEWIHANPNRARELGLLEF